MGQLGLSPSAFLAHMFVPGLAAAALCAGTVALRERRTLATAYTAPTLNWTPLSGPERHAASRSLRPRWPPGWHHSSDSRPGGRSLPSSQSRFFSGANGRSSRSRGESAHRSQGSSSPPRHSPCTPPRSRRTRLPGLLAIAIVIGAASALANNLPVSASATALLAAGPAAYAASIGLAVGALATPQGSVATLIAADLAGANAPPLPVRRLAPLALATVLLATLLLWTTLQV